MAEIVMGITSSHTPQLSSGVDMWHDHAERDRRNPALLGTDARYHTYSELLAEADPAIEKELQADVWESKYRRCQQAIETLAATLRAAAPDVALVIGDDQRELFIDDGIPAFACFTGPSLVDMPPDAEALARIPPGIRAAYWAVHANEPASHPVDAGLSAHIAEQLGWDDFDLTVFRGSRPGAAWGTRSPFPGTGSGCRRPPQSPRCSSTPTTRRTCRPPHAATTSAGRCDARWRPGLRTPGSRSSPRADSATSWSTKGSTAGYSTGSRPGRRARGCSSTSAATNSARGTPRSSTGSSPQAR